MDDRRDRDKAPSNIISVSASQTPSVAHTPEYGSSPHETHRPASGGLFRSSALRDSNVKGIRERRIERRSTRIRLSEDFNAPTSHNNLWEKPLDKNAATKLALSGQSGAQDLSRHEAESSKVTAKESGKLNWTPASPKSSTSSISSFMNWSSHSTPRAQPSPAARMGGFAQTPPFSPDGAVWSSKLGNDKITQALPSKVLPSPPQSPKMHRTSSKLTFTGVQEPTALQTSLQGIATSPKVTCLSPKNMSLESESTLNRIANDASGFLEDAIRRHQASIDKETNASSEAEALNIFIDFIIGESQIRRVRYAETFVSGDLDLNTIRQKLFKQPENLPLPPFQGRSSESPNPRRLARPDTALQIPQAAPESTWWNNYQPSLSPIASMSMSNDEISSRGRAPSRWWETKSSSDKEEQTIHRPTREAKYMGLPRALREAMQWTFGQALPSMNEESAEQRYVSNPDEYPLEKVGWHEEAPSHAKAEGLAANSKLYDSTDAEKLDISRLITLPPPYPRHHPAVNNSHPDLVEYRMTVRSITDLSEIKATRQRYIAQVEQLQFEHQQRLQENQRKFKNRIESQSDQGSVTLASTVDAEGGITVEEQHLARELAKGELETYQESVFKPMHAILTDRIERATTRINKLSSQLFDDAQNQTPNQTQEAGDEKPELLEKLTQLKWLFEAREQLHQELYDLVSKRNEKYQAVVSLPYHQNGQYEKVRETAAFFAKDAMDLRAQHEAAALDRLKSFLDVIEENVVRGVEVQLSAFWDIAPSLLALVQQVPSNLRGFQVQIPAPEYEENPSYHDHPLQYLYSLLSHAEKSTYQYIESQTNLLCLLHEVRSAMMRANCKLTEAERVRGGEAEDVIRRQMQASRTEEERLLTSDLKDKVNIVESQWREALGSHMEDLRFRVKRQLVAEGGWEDYLEQLEGS